MIRYSLSEISAHYPILSPPLVDERKPVTPEILPETLPALVQSVLTQHEGKYAKSEEYSRSHLSQEIAYVGRRCGLTNGQLFTLLKTKHQPTIGRIMEPGRGPEWFSAEFDRIVAKLDDPEKGHPHEGKTCVEVDCRNMSERDRAQLVLTEVLSTPTELDRLVAALDAETLDRAQLANLPTVEPIIHGVIGQHSIVLLAARHATYKTFVALDWSCCIATETPWLGTAKVEQGKVLYLAGEGAYGLHDRITAWENHNGIAVPPANLRVLPRTPRLFANSQELKVLIEFIKRSGFTFVVIDTLRRASGNAKQNANDDMGQVIDAIEDIKRATHNGSVLVLAHTEAEDGKVRGATVIEDDADVVYRMRKDQHEQIKLWRTKNKYGPEHDDYHLRPTPIGSSLVVELDPVLSLKLANKDAAAELAVYEAIKEAGGIINGLRNLRAKTIGLDNNEVNLAAERLAQRGLILIVDGARNAKTYTILKEWSQ